MIRRLIFSITMILLMGLTSCNKTAELETEKNQDNASSNEAYSPIEGNWILVSNEVNGKKIKPERLQQIKMFQDGYFSFFMYNSEGEFNSAGAGTYEIDGNIYKETFEFFDETQYIGSSDWQRWEMQGDTLIFYGFVKALLADGTDVTDDWGRLAFKEKRVRVKKE